MVITTHRFVDVPLLRAIEHLPQAVNVDGATYRFTGEVSSAPIIRGFNAHRAYFVHAGGAGHVDLSSANTWRCEMVVHVEGLRRDRAERVLLALRTAVVAASTIPAATAADDRIEACRTA